MTEGRKTSDRRRAALRRFGLRLASACGASLFTLVAVDLFLSHVTSLAEDPRKVVFSTIRGYGHCYRSHDAELPIDLMNAEDRSGLAQIMLGNDAEMLRDGTTRCVTYDLRRRRLGARPERSRQVAIVGDSFAFGEGVRDDSTLGFLLSTRFPAINFPSFAVAGAGVNQISEMVDRVLGAPRPPTDIIYFYNINDVLMTVEMRRRFSRVMDFVNVRWDESHRGDAGWLGRNSTLYHLFRRARFMARISDLTTKAYLDMYSDPVNAQALHDTLTTIEAIARRARERDVGFWVVLYPLLHKDARGRYPFDSIHQSMMEACARWGSGCIDGAQAFQGESRMAKYVVDPSDFHPNGLANRRMVEHLARTAGFLGNPGGPIALAPPPGPVRVPVAGLTPSSPGVTVEEASGGGSVYSFLGPMLSLDVEPATPGSYRVTLNGHGTACPAREREAWPVVGVYLDDQRVDMVSVTSVEPGRFVSAPFPLRGRATLRLVFLNEYGDDQCDRNAFLDGLDVQ